jgi:hypothetical protein
MPEVLCCPLHLKDDTDQQEQGENCGSNQGVADIQDEQTVTPARNRKA